MLSGKAGGIPLQIQKTAFDKFFNGSIIRYCVMCDVSPTIQLDFWFLKCNAYAEANSLDKVGGQTKILYYAAARSNDVCMPDKHVNA